MSLTRSQGLITLVFTSMVILVANLQQVHAGATIFFSEATSVGGGATLVNPTLNIKMGDNFDLGVWVLTAAPEPDSSAFDLLGLGMDIVAPSGNLLTALNHQIQEGDDLGGSTRRWLAATFLNGTLNNSATELVTLSNASGLDGIEEDFPGCCTEPTGFGLSAEMAHRLSDDSFDPLVSPNGGFHHSTLNLAPSGIGSTQLFFQVNPTTRIGYLPEVDTMVTLGAGVNQEVDFTDAIPPLSSLADGTIHTWLRGDVDKDGDSDVEDVDAEDVDAIFNRFEMDSSDPANTLDLANLDNDGDVDAEDVRIWVEDIKDTAFGDLNFDYKVDIVDFGLLAGGFGTQAGWMDGNLNGKIGGLTTVDILDFGILAGNFGFLAPTSPSEPAHMPEPTHLWLLGLILTAKRPRTKRTK